VCSDEGAGASPHRFGHEEAVGLEGLDLPGAEDAVGEAGEGSGVLTGVG